MSTPLPDDLKLYAAPSWWRCHRDKVWAAAFFALFAYAAVLPRSETINEGAERTYTESVKLGEAKRFPHDVSIAGSLIPSTVPSPLDCPRLRDGLWLRVMVKHTNHKGFSWHECYYGKLDRRDVL